MRVNMTKELMVSCVKEFCENEGIRTVKQFRSFFENWIIGFGEMDDDFTFSSKNLAKRFTVATWRKGYCLLDDSDIEACLATEEQEEKSEKDRKERIAAINEAENSKSEEEKKAEAEVECQMRDAGLEYNPAISWGENLKKTAINPELKIEEVKKYVGYGYHGGGRPSKGAEAKRATVSISGSKSELEELKKLSSEQGKTVSRFVLDTLIKS